MTEPVKFSAPPLSEIVCGALFEALPIKTAQVGLFWNRIRTDFPRVEEVAPLDPVIEKPVIGPPEVSIDFAQLPPLRRTWFLNGSGSHLLQLQQDRLLFNWKRVNEQGSYPSYQIIVADFEKKLREFGAFAHSENIGSLRYRQFELTYVNVLGPNNGLRDTWTDFLVDHRRDTSRERFLPEPSMLNWATSYQLPNQWGRLHVAAQTATLNATRERVIRLEVTARGVPPDPEQKRVAWFDMAHEWITRGFADSTPDNLHKLWERTS